MRLEARSVGREGGVCRLAADRRLWAWLLLRLKPVVSPVEWLVRQTPDRVYVVEVNRGFGWRPEAGFPTLREAFTHGRTLHGDCLPDFLQPPSPLSYKG